MDQLPEYALYNYQNRVTIREIEEKNLLLTEYPIININLMHIQSY